MKSMRFNDRLLKFGWGLAALAAGPVAASVAIIEPVSITSEMLAPAQHLLASDFHPDEKAPNSLEGLLANAKRASLAGDPAACLKSLSAAASKGKAIHSWLSALELECASAALVQSAKTPPKASEKKSGAKGKGKKTADKGADAKDRKPNLLSLERLHQAIAKAQKSPASLLNGAAAETLRGVLIKALLTALESDLKVNQETAAKDVEQLEELTAYFDDGQKAKLWRWSAELAYVQHEAAGAVELLKRSLAEQDSPETRARLISIESAIKAAATPAPAPSASPSKVSTVPNAELEASKEEIELVERATAALKAGDLVSAVDDAVKLITTFPGGTRAKWATERISESYWSIAEKSDVKLIFSRAQIVRKMQDVDGDRLADWARTMYNRGQWEDAMTLASRALEKLQGARSTAVLDLAAKAALASDQFEQARRFLDKLVLAHAGTPAAREALLRSGLLHFRQKEYPLAVADFERLLNLPQLNSWELPARYWLWRSLQKMPDTDKAGESADRVAQAAADLVRKYPFSYYGLRARLETNGGALDWKSPNEKFTAKFWLTAAEKKAWERVQILLKAGWLEEAQIEIKAFPTVKKADDKAVAALLAAAAGSYATATKLANEAWDENPELRREPLVHAAFPRAFNELINGQAEARKLDQDLLRGLIKQESSFNPRAVSTSSAYGLTQVIPPTAREIAQDLKQSAPNLPDDLFQPERSVQFGAYYLAKLLNKYSGSVPLALASYNAGPARIDRWLKARPSLKNLAALRSSAPEDELWFDEIPYGETSNYVKAILRNQLIYKMLANGRVQASEPIWSFAAEGR